MKAYLLSEEDRRIILEDIAALKNATGLNAGGGVASIGRRGQQTPEPTYLPQQRPILVKITANGAGDGFYEGVQVVLGSSGDPVTLTGGIVFDTANAGEIQESNLAAGVAVDTVWVASRVAIDGGGARWVFSAGGSLPDPGLEYHVLQLNAFLEPIWGYARIAP